MRIEIDVPRPGVLLLLIAAAVGGAVWASDAGTFVGGRVGSEQHVIRRAELRVRDVRIEQQALAKREAILRAELAALEWELERAMDDALVEELVRTRTRLLSLLNDQRAAEREILASLRQIWEAQAFMLAMEPDANGAPPAGLLWPVEPLLGISATFEDASYEERFGIPHRAIDIPVVQGSVVSAAADGVVAKVSENGLGFNAIIIRHAGGLATLYGHVSEFLVSEGQAVAAGDPIALSGGRPGSPGAGALTTGPHLHFEVIREGDQIDPLALLSPPSS